MSMRTAEMRVRVVAAAAIGAVATWLLDVSMKLLEDVPLVDQVRLAKSFRERWKQ